ncbi:Integrase catalytic domain-containing protein, partial [Aphis craccivora]
MCPKYTNGFILDLLLLKKAYVSNRVHQIITLMPDCRWLHIRSEENPADCASRGVLPPVLSTLSLYWQGPRFIHDDTATFLVLSTELPSEWYHKFSSYDRLVRVVAYIYRFLKACKKHSRAPVRALQRIELDDSIRKLVIMSQQCFYKTLTHELSTSTRVSSKHLSRLRPFLDPFGVIRVGGRLRYSNLNYGSKHPMLLAKQSHLSMLLCRRWHKISCHAGPRIMTALISREFWIVSIKSVLHSVTRACPVCVRFDAKPPQPIMADLPAARVQQSRPFARVGVDYAGPLQMREVRLRKSRVYKVYIAVFICFSVKAVHLEVVTEFSTEAFLAAFDRFVARRGLPSEIFSDCGTNFIGADKQLQLLINSPDGQCAISQARASCQWHFNPPSAPHFGGQWEAAVRSTKRLLIRTMVLNLRPLTPLTTDPTDLEYLSPGHFLIGQPLLAVPPRVSFESRVNLTQRWKLLDQCHQAFWRRWSTEYLTSLQGRSKWATEAPNVKVNDMVVIIDNQSPPLAWRLGRILEVLPGNDGVVRVVRLLTCHGQITRPV